MTFEVGRLSAALTLDGVSQFHRDLDQAGQRLQETARKGSAFGPAVAAGVRTAATTFTNLTAAAGAYLTILTKTGISYNSLQQNSRAALSVLLGDMGAANEQMAKLDDFARTSPFAKDVFIQAQQQLIGFGMEAEKVVPTLDAIQQSMAAMGRGNEDIAEIVRIIAQVHSTGKITGETLRQLGLRGLDAATIIGDAMGKTGSEIRESITDGAIDGREAIDILVDGMQERFGGAADRVKEQWSGAVDRIKAAQRDLGSVLAEPFVSSQGGGMAVSWGNQVADILRAIEQQAGPVMGILTRRGMPFFNALTEGLDSTNMAIRRWNAGQLDTMLDKLGNHAPAIGATAGALLAVGAQAGPLGRILQTLGISANPVVAAFIGLAAASPEVRESFKAVMDAGRPLVAVAGDMARVLSGQLNAALPVVTTGVELFAGVLRVATDLLEKIPTPVLIGAAAFLTLNRGLKTVEGPLKAVVEGIARFGQRSQVQATLGETNTLVGGLSVASMGAKGAVDGLGNALKSAFITNPIGIALTVVASAIGVWAMANADAQKKVEEHKNRVAELRGTLDETTGALTDASRAMVAESAAGEEMAEKLRAAGVSGDLYTQALIDGGDASRRFRDEVMRSSLAVLAQSDSADRARGIAEKLGISYETLVAHTLGYSDATDEVNAAIEATGRQWVGYSSAVTGVQDDMLNVLKPQRSLVESFDQMRNSIDEAQTEQARIREAMREYTAAMTDAERSNQRFNDALAVARDITADAETRVRALKQALDELTGGKVSAREAALDLAKSNTTLKEALEATDQEGNKLWESFLDGAGNIDVTTRSGQNFADVMQGIEDKMLRAIVSASDQAIANGDLAGALELATAAGNEQLEMFRQTALDAGLTEEAVNGLFQEYSNIPELVATLITDEGSIDETMQQLLILALQINATPDKTITIDEPLSAEIIDRLVELGYKVERLPNKQIRITETGSGTVHSVLDGIATRQTYSYVDIIYRDGGPPQRHTGIPLTQWRADGGLHTFAGNQIVEQFANGGFPTGIYRGGPPIFKFAEPETGWEAFISGKPGQERRNARIAMDALNRLGFPVVPLSALRGVPAFADGGAVAHARSSSAGHAGSSVTNWNMTVVNPVVRDDLQDAWETAQQEGASL